MSDPYALTRWARSAQREWLLSRFFIFAKHSGMCPDIDEESYGPVCDYLEAHLPNTKAIIEWRLRNGRLIVAPKVWKKAFGIFMTPRLTYKTSMISALILFAYLIDPSIRMMLGRATTKMAEETLRGITTHIEQNVVLRDIFGDLRADFVTWTTEEIVSGKRPPGIREPTIGTTGLNTSKTGAHLDFVILDDLVHELNYESPEQMETARRLVKSFNPVMMGWGSMLCVGCFASGTPVLRSDGTWVAIESLRVGEMVRTQTGDHAVEAVIDQGEAETVVVRSRRSVWRCTPNHPFLVCRKREYKWVEAQNLRKGDHLVCRSKTDAYSQVPWMPDDRPFDEDDAYAYGVLLGDGWANSNGDRPYLCVAGSKKELPQHIARFSRYGNAYLTRYGYIRVDSSFGRWFHDRGISGGAKGKRLQPWVFQLPSEYQRELLRGLCDADGTWNKLMPNLCALEISNEGLIDDVRALAKSCGIHATLSRHRSRTSYIAMRNKHYESDSYATHLNFNPSRNAEFDEVKSVEPGIRLKVWDLTVAEDPCYVANGVVVHNTRWGDNDLYGWIMDEDDKRVEAELAKGKQTERIWDRFIRGAYHEDGSLTFPCSLPETTIEEYRRDPLIDPKMFAAWILNVTRAEGEDIFTLNYVRYFDGELTAGLAAEVRLDPACHELYRKFGPKIPVAVVMLIDPAPTVGKYSDYTGIAIVGFDPDANWWVLHADELKMLPDERLRHILYLAREYPPNLVALENADLSAPLLQSRFREMGLNTKVVGFDPRLDRRKITAHALAPRGRTKKAAQIERLQHPLKDGRVFFMRGQTAPLVRQLTKYPYVDHDDVLDAFSMAQAYEQEMIVSASNATPDKIYAEIEKREFALEGLNFDGSDVDEPAPVFRRLGNYAGPGSSR